MAGLVSKLVDIDDECDWRPVREESEPHAVAAEDDDEEGREEEDDELAEDLTPCPSWPLSFRP